MIVLLKIWEFLVRRQEDVFSCLLRVGQMHMQFHMVHTITYECIFLVPISFKFRIIDMKPLIDLLSVVIYTLPILVLMEWILSRLFTVLLLG